MKKILIITLIAAFVLAIGVFAVVTITNNISDPEKVALKSDNPIVITVAKIITGVKGNSDKGTFKETYNEIIGYLNQNLI